MSRAGLVLPRLWEIHRDTLATPFPTVDVFLGPIVSGDPDDAVYVGYDGDPFGDMEVATHTEQWGALGNKSRDEEFDVRCCIMNRSGQTTSEGVAKALQRLYAMYYEIANAIHRNPSLDLGPPTTPIMYAGIRGLGSYMPLTEAGVEPRISYSVHIRTRV